MLINNPTSIVKPRIGAEISTAAQSISAISCNAKSLVTFTPISLNAYLVFTEIGLRFIKHNSYLKQDFNSIRKLQVRKLRIYNAICKLKVDSFPMEIKITGKMSF